MGAVKDNLYMPAVELYESRNADDFDDHAEPEFPDAQFDPENKGWLTPLEQAPF